MGYNSYHPVEVLIAAAFSLFLWISVAEKYSLESPTGDGAFSCSNPNAFVTSSRDMETSSHPLYTFPPSESYYGDRLAIAKQCCWWASLKMLSSSRDGPPLCQVRRASLAWIKAQALVCCSRWILSLSHALHIGQFLLRDSFLSQLAQQDLGDKSWEELLIIYIQCTSRLPVDGLLPGLLHRACYISFDPWFDVLSCPPGLEWLKWILTFVPRT